MASGEVDWGDLAERIIGSVGKERDVAEWEACREVMRNLGSYRPGSFKEPKDWGNDARSYIQRLRSIKDLDQLSQAAHADPCTFGRWRCAVGDFEAEDAARLQTVIWIMRTLYRLRDIEAFDIQVIDKIATKVGDLLVLDWKVQTVPLEGDYRPWVVRSTRRYDLLPRAWRFI